MVSDIFSFLSDTLAFSIVLVVKGGQGKMSKSLLRTDKEIAEILTNATVNCLSRSALLT